MTLKYYFYCTCILLLNLITPFAFADCNFDPKLSQLTELEFNGKKLYFVTESGQMTAHNDCSQLTVFDQAPGSNATFSQELLYLSGISKIIKNKKLLEVITWHEAEQRIDPSPAEERHIFFVWDGNLFTELVKLRYITSPYQKNMNQILVLLKQGQVSKAQQLLITSKNNSAFLEYSMVYRIHLATQFLLAVQKKLLAINRNESTQLKIITDTFFNAKFSNAIRTDDSNNDLSSINIQLYALKTLDICLQNSEYQCTDKIIVAKNPKTITALNDIAFFLGKLKKYNLAIYLLDYLTRVESKRVVSYLNLADLLWERNSDSDRENAVMHYRTYDQQMKYDKKLKRIPKRVSNRLAL